MAGNVSGLHVFANDVGPEPLALLDQNYDALVTALNTLSTFSNFYADTGTTNQLTVQTPATQFVSLTDGLQITLRVAATNTGAATLNVNGLGAQPILTSIGSELEPNALLAGSMVTLIYNAARQAWQLASGADSGQITAPLRVTNPDGQSALAINTDGSGYLGDFNGNGLSWDAACHFNFDGGATLSGITLPFSLSDGTYDFFNVQVPTDPPGTDPCVVSIAPVGSHAHQSILCLAGATDGTVLRVWGAENTVADNWLATFHGAGWNQGDPAIPPGFTGPNPGTSFGVSISAGTNASDTAFLVSNDGVGGLQALTQFMIIRGDGSGALGAAPNQLIWNAAGNFSTTGTATLPMPPLIDLPGINITNPQNGEALVYDQATNSWVNGAPVNALAALNDVALTGTPLAGQSLVYSAITQRWVNSAPILPLEGLTNAHVIGPAAGQVLTYSLNPTPGWVNATIPGYNFLTNLGVGANPQPGWVLTWDGAAWVGASPGQVATFPLSSLTDVGITTPLNRQVLTYDAPSGKWINAPAPSPSLATLPDVSLTAQSQGQVLAWDNTLHRWINSSLPGGSVIALDTLMDTNISDPQNNEVLTWDYASARWVNRALPPPAFAPVFTNPAAGQVLSYNGTNWVNAPTVTALANLSDVALATPSNGQMLVYNSGTNKWDNSNTVANTVITPPTGQIALTVNGVAGTNAFVITTPVMGIGVLNCTDARGGYITWQTNGIGIGDLGAALGNIGSGTASDMALAVRGNNSLYFSTNGVAREVINGTGNVTINAPSSGGASNATLTVLGSTTNQCLVSRILGGSYNPGLFVYHTESSATTRLDASGSGILPSGGMELATFGTPRVSINGAGNVTVNAPSSGYAVQVNGTASNWTTFIVASPAGSQSFGLRVNGGTTSADECVRFASAGGSSYFQIRGDGEIIFPTLRQWTTSQGYNLQVDTSGILRAVNPASALRFKTNIRNVKRQRAREVISALRLVTYTLKDDDSKRVQYGCIAEDAEKADPLLVRYNEDGTLQSIWYEQLLLLLLPLVQELLGMDEPEGEVYG